MHNQEENQIIKRNVTRQVILSMKGKFKLEDVNKSEVFNEKNIEPDNFTTRSVSEAMSANGTIDYKTNGYWANVKDNILILGE